MTTNSKIQWTHHTFNPWRGCTKVSAGCANCYAETMSKRNHAVLGMWGPQGKRVVAAESYWLQPLAWNRAAQRAGERHRVFCASLADVFEGPETMPAAEWEALLPVRTRLFQLIIDTPHLDWLLLTKRPQNIIEHTVWFAPGCRLPENVWIGTSVENQATANERIPHLLAVPARVRFLSMEPLLGPVGIDAAMYPEPRYSVGFFGFTDGFGYEAGLQWVIVGGESGPGARPMQIEWAHAIRDQCVSAGVAFFMKQLGGTHDKRGDIETFPPHLRVREFPKQGDHHDSSQ